MRELPAVLSCVYHVSEPYPRTVPLQEVYANLTLPAGTSDRPFVFLNMVQTFDGQAVLAGSAYTIGTDVDHYLLRQLRVHADAVLYGAGTLRKDDVIVTTHAPLQERRVRDGRSPNPLAVVVSATCAFSDEVYTKKFFRHRAFEKLIVTTPRASQRNIARLKEAGVRVEVLPPGRDGEVDLRGLLRHLAAQGIRRVLCEGGPTLNVSLAQPGLLDELFVTTTLRIGADPSQPRLFAAPIGDPRLELVSEFHYLSPQGVKEIYFRFRYPA